MSGLERATLAVSVLLIALFAAPDARAVYQCGPDKDDCKCGANNPYPCCSNGGNCTWWAWDRACCNWGVGLPGWGNANQWSGNAKAHPSYKVLSTPVVGAIATRVSGSYGHVAWVTAVSGSNVTVTEQNCWGGWGHSTATRDKSYWDGGFIVRNSQCECSPGQTQTESCGKCGERKRSCNSSCQWGGWGTCGGQGTCVPGETEAQACGNCGSRQRKCGASCEWDSFGACGGEGECKPGASDEQACGGCGKQARSCGDSCKWTSGACESDPEFSPGECDTGMPGVCAKGAQTCSGGELGCEPSTEPSEERCDGLDNDCDGEIDENACSAGGGWSKNGLDGGPGAQAADSAENDPVEGGCSVVSAPSDGSGRPEGWLLLAAAAWVSRMRRRK